MNFFLAIYYFLTISPYSIMKLDQVTIMEKEGLIKGINFMKSNNLSINHLLTDRHRQIDKMVEN